MKKLFSIALLSVALVITAAAQQSGVYYSTLLTGGTNNVPAVTTNAYSVSVTNAFSGYTNVASNPSVVFACAEHASIGVGLMHSCGANTATNANTIILGYKSFDNGNSFETTPSVILTNAWPTAVQQGSLTGFTNRVALFDVTTANATHIGFSIGNTHATLTESNITLYVNENNTRNYSEPARR